MEWLSNSSVIVVALFAVGCILSPIIFHSDGLTITLLKVSYILSFFTAWGAAVWVTLIGFIMFMILPRHVFGNLRSKMFPPYFKTVTICCAISVLAFWNLHPWKSATCSMKYQLGFLGCAFLFNLANLLVFTPMTLEVMKQRHKVERENEIGKEVGWSKNRLVAKTNPQLASLNTKFGSIHSFAALAHVLAFGCLAIHSWYLAAMINL